MANFNQNAVFCGLGTFSLVVPEDGTYFVEGKSLLPTIVAGGGPSGLVTIVNLNGSPVYTGDAGADGFRAVVECAALDALDVVFSSAEDADQPLNAVKTTIAIGLGL